MLAGLISHVKPIDRFSMVLLAAVSSAAVFGVGIAVAQAAEKEAFHPHDTRVFKAAACTKDHSPVEALYYIAASRQDMADGKPSPTAALMKEVIDHNWREIASRLTKDEMMEERFAERYHSLLSEMIPLLQQAVKEKGGWSISVSEVNSRPMDATKDKDVPPCR
jgi:hypothetical protein